MTDPTSCRISLDPEDPAELISYIPYRLKFAPSDSLVVLSAFRRARRVEIGAIARVDLEACYAPTAAAKTRNSFIATLKHHGEFEGFIVVYSEEYFSALNGETLEEQTAEERSNLISLDLARWCDLEQFHPTRTFVVGQRRWRCLSCLVAGHCPPGGRRKSAFSATEVTARMVAMGNDYAPSREELISLPPHPPREVMDTRVEEELRTLYRYRNRARPQTWKDHLESMWGTLIEHLSDPRHGYEMDCSELAVLALSLHDVALRDHVIYSICTGKAFPRGMPSSEARFAEMFSATSAPDLIRMNSALHQLEEMAGMCPVKFRAPILAVWAWSHWWVGNGAEANILVDLALQHSENYSLARTMRRVLNRSLLPPWLMKAGEED